jgi:hypothetical protein
MSVLLVKPGVEFTTIAPAGFRILWALTEIATQEEFDVTITSACDGLHSGPDDPHHHGEAYDVRCHDMLDPAILLQDIQHILGTAKFFAFIEEPGSPNEHIHIQLRRGAAYP